MRNKFILSLAAVALLVPLLGFAADIRSTDNWSSGSNSENLYLYGEAPTTDGDVSGDLTVAGSTVTINGNVEQNVLGFAGDVTINGNVGESVRVAAGEIIINGEVGEDVFVAGGDVIIGADAVIHGDVTVFAGTLDIQGSVLGNIESTYLGNFTLSGNIAGDANLECSGTVTIESTAVIVGTLNYKAAAQADVDSAAQIGSVNYSANSVISSDNNVSTDLGSALLAAAMGFVTLFVFMRVAPKTTRDIVTNALSNPWKNALRGLLWVVALPIVAILLLFTYFGWGVAGYISVIYVLMFALSSSAMALLGGSLAWKIARKENELKVTWQTIAVGVVLLALIKLIPVVSWIVTFVVFLIGFGTIIQMLNTASKLQRGKI